MTPTEALQQTLAAEHAAVHVLAALAGASRSLPEPPDATSGISAATRHRVHRGRREHLVVLLRSAGAAPVAALPAYALPAHDTLDDLRRGVLEVEDGCLTTYAALVAASTEQTRTWAIEALQETALATLAQGAEPSPFPGADDLLPR